MKEVPRDEERVASLGDLGRDHRIRIQCGLLGRRWPLFATAALGDSTVSVAGIVRVPVPSGWRVEIGPEVVRIADPQGDVMIAVGGWEVAESEDAAREAWRIAFSEEPSEVMWEESVVVSGEVGVQLGFDEGYAIVWNLEDTGVVLLVKATDDLLDRESGTLAALENGLAFGDETLGVSPALMEL